MMGEHSIEFCSMKTPEPSRKGWIVLLAPMDRPPLHRSDRADGPRHAGAVTSASTSCGREPSCGTDVMGQQPLAPQKKFVGDALRHLPGTLPIGVDFSESCQWNVPKFQSEGSKDAIGRREQSVILFTHDRRIDCAILVARIAR